MTSAELQILFDDSHLRIARRRPDAATHVTVVAFAGVQGAFGGIPVEEFSGALLRTATPHDAIFVVDKTRGWYSETADIIETTVKPLLAGRCVVTLGNSMGGFGAFLFGERLGAATALAICPQYAITTELAPFETRWRDLAIALPHHAPCLPEQPSAATTRLALTGADHDADMAHARLIHQRLGSQDGVFALKGCGHDVSQVLKRSGALTTVLDAVLRQGGRAGVAAALDGAVLDYDLWAPARNGTSDASKSG